MSAFWPSLLTLAMKSLRACSCAVRAPARQDGPTWTLLGVGLALSVMLGD